MLKDRINEILKNRDMSAYDLANKITDIDKSAIYKVVNGQTKNPSQKTIRAIAKALEVTVSELLGENEKIYIKQVDENISFGVKESHIDDYTQDDIKLALEIIDLIKKHQSRS